MFRKGRLLRHRMLTMPAPPSGEGSHPGSSFSAQLPADEPGKTVEHGPSGWGLVPPGKLE